jgi:hypothetical protein
MCFMNVYKFMKVMKHIDEINFSIFMRIYNFMKFMRFMNVSILQVQRDGDAIAVRDLKSFRRKNVLNSGEGGAGGGEGVFPPATPKKGRGKRAQYNEFHEHILFHCINEYHDTWEAPDASHGCRWCNVCRYRCWHRGSV